MHATAGSRDWSYSVWLSAVTLDTGATCELLNEGGHHWIEHVHHGAHLVIGTCAALVVVTDWSWCHVG